MEMLGECKVVVFEGGVMEFTRGRWILVEPSKKKKDGFLFLRSGVGGESWCERPTDRSLRYWVTFFSFVIL